MSGRLIIAAALTLSLFACTPKRNEASSVTQPDAMPTTVKAWLATAHHDAVWYAHHTKDRRVLLKTCDANKALYRTNPDCSNASSARVGVGDY